MPASQIVALSLLAFLVFWAVGAYNRLIRLRNEITNAFAQIDVQLKRRHDLIPNLVEVARKFLEHERDTLGASPCPRPGHCRAANLVKAAQTRPVPFKA